jgi:hypothetical protein
MEPASPHVILRRRTERSLATEGAADGQLRLGFAEIDRLLALLGPTYVEIGETAWWNLFVRLVDPDHALPTIAALIGNRLPAESQFTGIGVFGRVQSPWLPASGDETYEIMRTSVVSRLLYGQLLVPHASVPFAPYLSSHRQVSDSTLATHHREGYRLWRNLRLIFDGNAVTVPLTSTCTQIVMINGSGTRTRGSKKFGFALSQLMVLACLAIAAGRARGVLGEEDEGKLVRALIETPRRMAEALALEPQIERLGHSSRTCVAPLLALRSERAPIRAFEGGAGKLVRSSPVQAAPIATAPWGNQAVAAAASGNRPMQRPARFDGRPPIA